MVSEILRRFVVQDFFKNLLSYKISYKNYTKSQVDMCGTSPSPDQQDRTKK